MAPYFGAGRHFWYGREEQRGIADGSRVGWRRFHFATRWRRSEAAYGTRCATRWRSSEMYPLGDWYRLARNRGRFWCRPSTTAIAAGGKPIQRGEAADAVRPPKSLAPGAPTSWQQAGGALRVYAANGIWCGNQEAADIQRIFQVQKRPWPS